MTATLTVHSESQTRVDAPGRDRGARQRARTASPPRRPAEAPAPPTLRISPVPRSEPLTDEERVAGEPSPVVARLLPPDLATGVQVRRGAVGQTVARGSAGPARTRPRPAGPAGAVDPGPAPTVLRPPDRVTAVVTAPLHVARQPPAAARSTALHRRPADPPGQQPGAEVLSVVAPGLGRPPADAPTAGSFDLRLSARRLLSCCVEVLGGFRPVAQLRPYCAPERFDAIANRLLRPVAAGRGHGATRSSIIASRVAATAGRPARAAGENRISIRRVQICEVMDGIAELVVVLSRSTKVWAMTMRMERNGGRWLCMHLEVL